MARIKMSSKKRIIQAFIIIMALIFVLALRTAWIQIVKADEYSEKATNQQTSDIPIEAKRGSIYDTNGQELAASATCYSVWVRPSQIKKNYSSQKIDELSKKLAVILNEKSDNVKKDMTSRQTLLKMARYLDKNTCDKIRALKVSGLEIAENTKRYYPLGTSAAQLLGSVNDDNEGRTGIESQFDGYLSGVAGRWIKETDINGDTLSYGSQKYYQAKDGYNVQLTIDEVLQHYAEKAIAKGITKTKAKRIMSADGTRKIAILGGMNELGEDSRAYHEEIGRYAAEKGVDLFIGVAEKAADMVKGAEEGGCSTLWFETREELYPELPKLLRTGDVVLIKASNALHMYDNFEQRGDHFKDCVNRLVR